MTTTPTITRLDQIKTEIMETYVKKFADASALGAKGDVAGMSKAIMSIQQEIQTKANQRMEGEKTTRDAQVEKEKAGKTALELHAQDVFKAPVEAISAGFLALETVGQVIVRIEKDSAGHVTSTVIVGNLTKLGGGNGTGRSGPRNHKVTIDGKEFDTIALGWKGVMGDAVQPTKLVGKGESAHQSKSRDVAVTALEAAGHKVS